MIRRKSIASKATEGLSQLEKFKAAARELGADDDPERFKERVKRIGGAKAPQKPQEMPEAG